ncbi:ATP-binding protein [Spirosoma fluminis]
MTLFVRLVLLLGLFGLFRSARSQGVVNIDSLPADGIPLKSGWRWHPGDNRAWASPGFDDSRWDTIRPSRNSKDLPQFQKAEIGWFRLRFALDSTVAREPLAAQIRQMGASELYIDGILVQQLGKVGLSDQQEEPFTPATWERYSLPYLSPGPHLVAVRLSQHHLPWYVPKFWHTLMPVFSITLVATKGLVGQVANGVYTSTSHNYMVAGIFLMLSIIHFLYYLYRKQRVNLFFGLMALFCCGSFVLAQSFLTVTNSLVFEWVFLAQGTVVMAFMIFLLTAYYTFLQQPFSWLFRIIVVGLIAPKIIAHFVPAYSATSLFITAFTVLLFFDCIRISVIALRRRHPNARFVLFSLLAMVAVLLIGSLASIWVSYYYPAYSRYLGNVTNLVFFLLLPLSFAVILARDYAQTNRNLEERLKQVEQLSTEKELILKEQNETLERQVAERTSALTQSLADLRDTQQQLIQREKMASLGELTAGIAHEIQNPLNFVNNFADVSVELVTELNEERDRGVNRDEGLEAELLGDLEQNLQKISQHGNRAAGIVRGMLDHARLSSGQRERTDINALVDEYLRLAYHGIRAKDENFNAHLVTNFDAGAGKLNVAPQDLGRVFLNLFNNAFYAVQERSIKDGAAHVPTVTVRTHRMAGGVRIMVSDNGSGVPDPVKEKIFQPFFTTKPTGQGTGLGLSLSYDIVTKGHQGTLALDTSNSGETSFIITLPD